MGAGKFPGGRIAKHDVSLGFYGKNGESKGFGRYETTFFFEPLSPTKLFHGIFVLKELVKNGSLAGPWLLFKGFVKSLVGNSPPLSEPEYLRLWEDVIDFRPEVVVFTLRQMRLIISCSQQWTQIMGLFNQIIMCNQYGVSEKNVKGKVVVDAGANVGVFTMLALKLGARRVYAFEPVKETFEILKQNLELNGLGQKAVLVNRALGRKKGEGQISYSFGGDGEASMSFITPKKKHQKVKIITIDSFIRGRGPVNLIKIDAEGCESQILLGAKRTISKYKPILSFSAYHRPEDKQLLPEIVKSIRPDYNCKLHKKAEEDFYCK